VSRDLKLFGPLDSAAQYNYLLDDKILKKLPFYDIQEFMKSLGICIGASTIKTAEIDGNLRIGKTFIRNHECNPRAALRKILESPGFEDYSYVTLTGRKFKDLVNLPVITEPEATERALNYLLKNQPGRFNALISLGSENFILYELNERGSIINVRTGNKCASGTGEFFLQQIRRMDLAVEEAIGLAEGAEPYCVAGRCSVFCKSDCTHALNKGVPIGRVCAGLGNMIAEKILELLKSMERKNILLVGGVTRNSYVVSKLRQNIGNVVIPENAQVFEALGAALYAFEKKKKSEASVLIKDEKASFGRLPPLNKWNDLVEFKEHANAIAEDGDECIIGLDVGSTTTKAVLLRANDDRVIASVYLRTNGNPVQASRECYRGIYEQLGGRCVKITGLGVTGSGRHIAGLHALTEGIINEIIAHASGAAFFSKEVDTIIEIGGQDAKYTHLVNGVPCDYAMNEACSAGTGSFLEEAAKESLNINYLDIQHVALQGKNPPNFNDQCAAFISSDIKNASHESIPRSDIVAGLVYSICMNYNNRVKGSRKTGEKIFMQGGVCYNRAVPLAMAGLLNKRIIVPPDPGLIGAFGVALEIKNRLRSGEIVKSEYSLKELAEREAEYGESFACPGTKENCDRGCHINIIKIKGKNYPFGGVCNKYYNTIHHLRIDPEPLDLIAKRQELVFRKNGYTASRTVGIPKSFYTNILFPLYYSYFAELGYDILLGETVDPEGAKMTSSSFCFPAEIAHGMFMDLKKKNPDYIFLPQIAELHVEGNNSRGKEHNCTCVLAQSEPYYITSAFRDIRSNLLSPVLNFSGGLESMEDEFIKIGKKLGAGRDKSRHAFTCAVAHQKEFNDKKKGLGDRLLKDLQQDSSRTGIVVFGRAYNAFADESNLGIPKKFASRGVYVIPFDSLRYENEESVENMNWAIGQEILKAARVVKRHPQLFGAYITNFSCGPDSFLVGYFRDIMKAKPSLTLEIDSHSADAGINTRIDAFLDIISRYRNLEIKEAPPSDFRPATLSWVGGKYHYISSDGNEYPVKDNRVKLVVPSMGRTTTELAAAAFRGIGFNAEADRAPDFNTLMIGRANTSCKECLPLILTTASLLETAGKRRTADEMLLYFMPTAPGNCRFSQYYVFQKKLIEKKQLKNVALLTLTAENRYAGLGNVDQITILKSLVVADIMDDIRNALLVLPVDKRKAEEIFNGQMSRIKTSFETGGKDIYGILKETAAEFSKIDLKYPLSEAKKVLLTGEIYVRKDEFCSQEVVLRLAKRGVVVKRAPVLEWLYYVDYIVKNYLKPDFNLGERTELLIRNMLHHRIEKKIKGIMAASGLYEHELIDMEKIIDTGSKFINPAMTGEAIVIIGTFFREIIRQVHGVISIGPFACMPTRVTESILSHESNVADNKRVEFLENIGYLKKFDSLPFLSVEADGNPFPQIVEARIEAFTLQVERLYSAISG